MRLSRAEALNDKADEYARVHGTDYATALSIVVRLYEGGPSEPSLAEVEKYAADHGLRFEDALYSVFFEWRRHAQAFNTRAGRMTDDQYDADWKSDLRRWVLTTSDRDRALHLIEQEDRSSEQRGGYLALLLVFVVCGTVGGVGWSCCRATSFWGRRGVFVLRPAIVLRDRVVSEVDSVTI